MHYTVGFIGKVTIPADSKHDAVKKIEMKINQILNFDPSALCSAYVIHPKDSKEGENDGDKT